MWDLQEIGAPAAPVIEHGLESDDHQQRHLCAALLMSIDGYAPSRRMLEVCVEGLKHDLLPSDGECYNYVFNAADGTRYLIKHMAVARGLLVGSLDSDDPQQQFLAATLLAYSGDGPTCHSCATVLLPHLRDNKIQCDALFAAIALRRISSCCINELHAAKTTADVQQAAILEVLIACATGESADKLAALNARLPDLGLPANDPTAFPLENVEMWWNAADWPLVAVETSATTPAAAPQPSDRPPSP